MTVLLIKEWRRTKKYLVKYLMFSISLVTTNQLRRLKIIQLDICGFVTVINSHIVTVWTYKLHIMKNNMYSLQSHYFTYSISHKIVTMKSTKITKLVPHKICLISSVFHHFEKIEFIVLPHCIFKTTYRVMELSFVWVTYILEPCMQYQWKELEKTIPMITNLPKYWVTGF